MATIFSDDYTGTAATDVESSTPETGTSWTKHGDSGARALQLNGSGLAGPSAGAAAGSRWVYYATPSNTNADHFVEVVGQRPTGNGGWSWGLAARFDVATGDGYFVTHNRDLGNGWQLWKRVSGAMTQLGSTFTQSWGIGASRTVKLVLTGTSLEVFIDAVSRITATDSAISAAGRGAILVESQSGAATVPADYLHDSFLVDETSGAAASSAMNRRRRYIAVAF